MLSQCVALCRRFCRVVACLTRRSRRRRRTARVLGHFGRRRALARPLGLERKNGNRVPRPAAAVLSGLSLRQPPYFVGNDMAAAAPQLGVQGKEATRQSHSPSCSVAPVHTHFCGIPSFLETVIPKAALHQSSGKSRPNSTLKRDAAGQSRCLYSAAGGAP